VEPCRQREQAAFGDGLRAPRDPFTAVEQPAHERMRLQLLQQVVDRELGIAVVEAHDHPQRDELVPHRVDEGAAELAVLRRGAQRPAHRVDDPVERLRDTPDLLDAERPHLRVFALEPEVADRRPGQVPLRSLGQDRDARDNVRPRLEVL
jgi:hypothetical protein